MSKRKSFTTELKNHLLTLHEVGCTDSDIIDFCNEHNANINEAFQIIAEYTVPIECMGCKHIQLFSSMYPCNACSRSKKDYFEPKD